MTAPFLAHDGPDHRIAVTVPDRAALLAAVADRFAAGQGFTVATINLDHLVKLGRDPAFAEAYAAQTFVVADGNPVVWMSRLAKRPVGLVPGADMVRPLAAEAAKAGVPVALLGATEETLAGAQASLEAELPDLNVVARIVPSAVFDPAGAEADDLIRQLGESGARFCFLALGAPRQEIFSARAHAALPAVGFASIGAGLDFLAGTQVRAPAWVRKMALEWAWRLATNPGRLAKRYLDCALILPRLALTALRQRRAA